MENLVNGYLIMVMKYILKKSIDYSTHLEYHFLETDPNDTEIFFNKYRFSLTFQFF